MSRARELAARYWGIAPALFVVALFALRACLVTPPLDNLAPAAGEPTDPPGTTARAGSLYIARGGPVIIGFQSESKARLVIGPVAGADALPARELTGAGLVKDRLILPAGPVAVRFAAPHTARLVWSPVGRRGDPEYVPASSLAPAPPSSATFGAWVGAAPLDGVIAALLLVALVATLLALARHRLRGVPRETWLAMAVLFAAACVVRWIDLGGFGQTWDEDVNWAAGRNYVTNVLALDLSPASWLWNSQHPPVMKYLDGIGAQLADGYGPARALSAIWTALGCALLVPIGRRLYSARVGILAAMIAALLPPLVAHGQIVGHESPTVLWWALAVLLALTLHDGEPSVRSLRIRLVWLGVVIGVAIASRFVNGLVGVLAVAIVAARAPSGRAGRVALEGLVIMPPIALLTLYALWPYLWLHPITALHTSLATLTQQHSAEPFLGAFTNHPGPHYFLLYLGATLPVLVLLGVAAYAVRTARDRSRAALVVAAWFIIPLGVIASPVRQDGVRYVMPCILALAVASAAGWEWLATLLERRVRRGYAIVTGVLAAYLAVTLVLIHPYYLDYFGEQVGGPGNVARAGLFETAWWGEGVDRAVSYVNAHAAPGARVFRNCIEPAHLAWFREDLWTPMTNNPQQADWIVTYAPQSHPCGIPKDAKRVFSVTAEGATLAEVWQRP